MKNLLDYYKQEILFLRQEGHKFAQNYPEIAKKIDLHSSESTDPHTERLIESFAFLNSRIDQAIDRSGDKLPYYILSALYPGLTNAFPACSIVEFSQNNSITNNVVTEIQKDSKLYYTLPSGQDCIFKTVYPITIYPLKISSVKINSEYQLAINLKSLSVPIENMNLDNLLFHISTSYLDTAIKLYMSMFGDKQKFYIKIDNTVLELPSKHIKLCGYEPDETVVPIPRFMNYSFEMIREVLVFLPKFMFFRLVNLDKFFELNSLHDISEFSILVNLDNKLIKNIEIFKQEINNDILSINSTPIVNLFEYTSDSFRFDSTKNEYALKADSHEDSNIEIYSIQSVYMIEDANKSERRIPEYFGMKDYIDNGASDLYWIQVYEKDQKFVHISFVDTKFDPNKSYNDIVYAKLMCINKLNPRDIIIGQKLNNDNNILATIKTLPNQVEYIFQNNSDIWNLITQLSFTKLDKNGGDTLLNNIKNIIKMYSGQSGNHILINNIKHVNITRQYIRKSYSFRDVFIPQLIFDIQVTNSDSAPYLFIFLKVLHRYVKNILPINHDLKFNLLEN